MFKSQRKAVGQKEGGDTFVDGELFSGPSNDEILGNSRRQNYTAEQKIYDLPRARARKPFKFFRSAWVIRRAAFTARIRRWRDLDERLPLPVIPSPSSSLRDVYLLSRAHETGSTFGESLVHWSVYCEGLAYHLSADSASTEQTLLHSDILSSARIGERTMLRVDKYDASSGRTPLVCYHIGQTDLDDAEIICLAKWIIGKLNRYDFLHSNCHHFSMALCVRILCRRRHCAVFMGSPAQLYAWEQHRKNRLEPGFTSSLSQGFELCPAEGSKALRDCKIDGLCILLHIC